MGYRFGLGAIHPAQFLFPSLFGYHRSWLTRDILAGLTVWAVLVPEALAYATVAGVSPVVGLYAAPGALIAYAALGSSRQVIAGPMAATAALSAAVVGDFASPGDDAFLTLTTTLALVTGVIAVVAGIARFGFIANFISEPVMKGFITGLALTIIVGQLADFLGIEKGSGNFFEKSWDILRNLGDASGYTTLVGIGSLALVLGLRRAAPRIPASLVAVAAGVAAVLLFDLDSHGVEIVGNIDSGAPDLGFPSGFSFGDARDLIPGSIGIALVGFAEGLGAAKNYATKHGYNIDANRELLGLGGGNLLSGLSGGMVVNGSLSKSAVNDSAGAKSQVSGLTVAALTVLTFLFLTGLFEDLPMATLAAIVIAALIDLVDIPAIVELYRIGQAQVRRISPVAARADFIAAVAALFGVLLFDTLPGLAIGVAASVVLLVWRASYPRLARLGHAPGSRRFLDLASLDGGEEIPGVLILRVESPLFFANADGVREEVERQVAGRDARAVVLDLQTVPFIDITAAKMLTLLHESLEQRGVRVVAARAVGQVRGAIEPGAGPITLYPTVAEAVDQVRGA